MPKDTTPQNFAEKAFANSHKTPKFAKVFSLESFPLYSIQYSLSIFQLCGESNDLGYKLVRFNYPNKFNKLTNLAAQDTLCRIFPCSNTPPPPPDFNLRLHWLDNLGYLKAGQTIHCRGFRWRPLWLRFITSLLWFVRLLYRTHRHTQAGYHPSNHKLAS